MKTEYLELLERKHYYCDIKINYCVSSMLDTSQDEKRGFLSTGSRNYFFVNTGFKTI